MVSFKALALAALLSVTAATPTLAQAAIQEPGLFAFYYPNLDVLNEGTPTPAARLSPDWPALRGACAAIGAGAAYCGDRYGSRDFGYSIHTSQKSTQDQQLRRPLIMEEADALRACQH